MKYHGMEVVLRFEHSGKRYTAVYDEHYQTRGSYGYETEEETKAAEDEEIEKLNRGDWVVVGCIVERPCPGIYTGGSEHMHCGTCTGWDEVDSLWGIVVDNTDAAIKAACLEVA